MRTANNRYSNEMTERLLHFKLKPVPLQDPGPDCPGPGGEVLILPPSSLPADFPSSVVETERRGEG